MLWREEAILTILGRVEDLGSKESKTILLVEDEIFIAMSEKRVLERNGYRVVIAAKGETAVEIVENANDIDLVLMDINLGTGMLGTEAAEKILERRELPLAFLSSHTEPDVVEKTEGITSYGYIVKNSGETVLLASIKMAFRLFEAKLKEKQKTKALQASEAKYRRLIENSPDIVYVYSISRGGVFYSPSVEKVLGYSPDYLYSLPFLWKESIHHEDRTKVLSAMAGAAEGRAFAVEYRLRDSRGDWRWIFDRSLENLTIDGEAQVEGLATDITDRRQHEEALRKKVDELERIHRLTVDRELSMIKLKKEINGLHVRIGQVPKYTIVAGPDEG